MKVTNAIKKLQKAGFTITREHGFFTAEKPELRRVVEFAQNGTADEITCIGFRHKNDKSDSMTDYCATMFCDNLTQAIKLAHM